MKIPYDKPLIVKSGDWDGANIWLQRLGTRGYVGSVRRYPGTNSLGIRINHCQISKSYLTYWLESWHEKGIFRQIAHHYTRGEFGLLIPDVQQLLDRIIPQEPLWNYRCLDLDKPVVGVWAGRCKCRKHPGWLDEVRDKPRVLNDNIHINVDPSDGSVINLPPPIRTRGKTICCPYHFANLFPGDHGSWVKQVEQILRRWKPNG